MGYFACIIGLRYPSSLPQCVNRGRMPNQVQQLESQRAIDVADVFISYSRKNIEFAQRLHHEPWVDGKYGKAVEVNGKPDRLAQPRNTIAIPSEGYRFSSVIPGLPSWEASHRPCVPHQ